MSPSVLKTIDGRGVATVTLDRPERHNAFDDGLIGELTETLIECGEAADVRAVVLTGSGASFCAGADLNWMRRCADLTFAANVADAQSMARLMQTLDRLPKPTLAVVNGSAYGGGVGLVACCDIAIAAQDAQFGLSEVKLGLIPAVISPYVVAAIGARQARRFFLTAETFSSETAEEIGLLHATASREALEPLAERILSALLRGGPLAQADAKGLIFAVDRPVDEGILAEASRRIAERRASAEGREGVEAFLGRRKPSWLPAEVS